MNQQRTNALLRSLVWLGAFACWAYLKKPTGTSVLQIQSGVAGVRRVLSPGRALASTTDDCARGEDVMNIETITIRTATHADARALASFGARTFRETFEPDNRPEDVAAYVAETYSAARQRTEVDDPDRTTLIAESPDGLAAFAQIRSSNAPLCVSGPLPIELLRFYVDRAWHGRGLARNLMAAVVAAAEARGARTLWLGVWEHNLRAIAFYSKYGCRDVGSHEFVLGTDHQIDRVMVLPLDRSSLVPGS